MTAIMDKYYIDHVYFITILISHLDEFIERKRKKKSWKMKNANVESIIYPLFAAPSPSYSMLLYK